MMRRTVNTAAQSSRDGAEESASYSITKQAAEQIPASFPEASLIVSSGYSNDPVMANFKEFGFSGAIAKPYSIGEFERVLNRLQEN